MDRVGLLNPRPQLSVKSDLYLLSHKDRAREEELIQILPIPPFFFARSVT
jgi:hypothetical protein